MPASAVSLLASSLFRLKSFVNNRECRGGIQCDSLVMILQFV